MRTTSMLFTILGVGLLGACSGTEPSQDLSQSRTRQIAGIELTLITDRRVYPAGTPVTITIRAFNPSSNPVSFTFPTTQQYDMAAGQNSVVTWNYAFGRSYPATLTTLTLQPGETWERTQPWDRTPNGSSTQVAPGNWDIQGALPTTSNDLPTSVLTVELQ